MKYYLIYHLSYVDGDKVTIKEEYMTKEDAENNLETVAVGYVREEQGKQQADVCKQYDKTPDDILKNTSLKEGMYIIKTGDKYTLYEKTSIAIPGRVWGSTHGLKVNKLGMFYYTEYNFDENNFRLSGSVVFEPRQSSKSQSVQKKGPDFVEELKNTIKQNKGQVKLRPVKQSTSVLDELLAKYNENGGKFVLKKIKDDSNPDEHSYKTLLKGSNGERYRYTSENCPYNATNGNFSSDTDSSSESTCYEDCSSCTSNDTDSSFSSTESSCSDEDSFTSSDSESSFDTDNEIDNVLKKMNNAFKEIDETYHVKRFTLPPPPPPFVNNKLYFGLDSINLPPPPPPPSEWQFPVFNRSKSDSSITSSTLPPPPPPPPKFGNNYEELLKYEYNLITNDELDKVKINQL